MASVEKKTFDNKLLAQARPGNTSTATFYNPSVITNVYTLIVCNTSVDTATYSVFWDDDGTTYDQTTALCYQIALPSHATEIINFGEMGLTMLDTAGNIGIQSGTASAITYSLFGETKIR